MFWCWFCWMCQAGSCHYTPYTYKLHKHAEWQVYLRGIDDIYGDGRRYVIGYNLIE